jgi:hypothetical protein
MMATVIYGLCTVLCAWIAWSLARHHARTRSRVLFWSAMCFSVLTLSNLMLVFDKLLLPGQDLAVMRKGTALLAICLLLYGLVFEDD